MRNKKRSFRLVYSYIGREYVLSFLVAFAFFFFIFFVNQILVLAQKIIIKNVKIKDMILLVVLSIPQFLMYTMPFSSLASASMVIGNFSSQNEILAIRSNGIHTNKIFKPIVQISLILSILTLLIADMMIPYTTIKYRELYSKILQSMPAIELSDYSSTQFGKRVISNGPVEDNKIEDVMIFDNSDKKKSKVIIAEEGLINIVDVNHFVYEIELKNPKIMITDATSSESYQLAEASQMDLYLDLSSNAYGMSAITPSQMSIGELTEQIKKKIQEGADGSSFYLQYYRSELQKKIALSMACTFLVFLAFPISFFKVKNGRLIGFGLSMFIACLYWFFLYYMHLTAVSVTIHPAFLMWLPDAVVFLTGLILLGRLNK